MSSRRKVRLAFLARNPHCHYCGLPLDERNSALDRKVPKCAGGTNDQRNLSLACRYCVTRRGGMTVEQLLLFAARVAVAVNGPVTEGSAAR